MTVGSDVSIGLLLGQQARNSLPSAVRAVGGLAAKAATFPWEMDGDRVSWDE